MPKTDDSFDPRDYTPVAERITRFYTQHPSGRIITKPRRVSDLMVLFEARVYRTSDDARPAATGFACERPGDGDINTVACVENTETSAIGRALANLGITAGRERASREEMTKADRARNRAHGSRRNDVAPDSAVATTDDLREVAELLAEATALGFDKARITEIRDLLHRAGDSAENPASSPEPVMNRTVRALHRELRAWLHAQRRMVTLLRDDPKLQ